MRQVLIFCLVSTACMTCEHKEHNVKTSVEALDAYVDSVKNLDDETISAHWNKIERGYQTHAWKADVEEKTEKERKDLEEAKEEYKQFRSKYTSEPLPEKKEEVESQADVAKPESRRALRNALFGEGKIGADINFQWVNAQNIRQVYDHFVNSVKANKGNFSREDWDEIKVLYEALDTRKNEVEKDLSAKDNIHIAKRKVEFASYKAIERPTAKVKENEKAKEEGGK